MEEHDTFWTLEGASEISSQEDLFDHLKKSDHLKLTVYKPECLTREYPKRAQRIDGKSFERASFSKTKIDSIIFRNCNFIECQFIGTEITECEFHNCRFIKTNTHKIKIYNTYINPLSFKHCLDKKKHQNIGVHLYQCLMNNSRTQEQIEFERDAQFLFLRWKRYQDTYELRKQWSRAKNTKDCLVVLRQGFVVAQRLSWEKFFGSGIRLRYFFGTVLLVVFIATCVNYVFRENLGLAFEGKTISSWDESLYFTIVSLTTLGYGDITPTTTIGRVAASVQSVVGFSLFALLASMLFRRVAP